MYIVKTALSRYIKKRTRVIMRGYRYLRESGRIGDIAFIKISLTNSSLGIKDKDFSELIYGLSGVKCAEVVTRQYLLHRLAGLGLNKALLYGLGKQQALICYPLPRVWQELLKANGFKVSTVICDILWAFLVLLYWGYGFLTIISIAFSWPRKSQTLDNTKNASPYVYFENLGSGNIPRVDGKTKDIISWYLKWPGALSGIKSARHNVNTATSDLNLGNVNVLFQRTAVPDLCSLKTRFQYLMWGVSAALFSFFDMVRGRWWHALLLNQSSVMGQVSFTKPNKLAKEYLFHNSGWIYKPLWTYEAEACGSIITFYFYSTNCQNFKRGDEITSIAYGWQVMSWPRYLVWNKGQANFVRNAVLKKDAEIIVCGPIWFEGNEYHCPHPQKKVVAMFDVTPHRHSRYCILGLDFEYYIPDVVNLFRSDVSDVIKRNNLFMLWKKKREIGSLAHPRYRHQSKMLLKEDHIVLVASEAAAFDVIESSIASISMPFTSTAFIARSLGKPSVYYDSSGLLDRDDEAAHGIPILQSKEELSLWLSRLEISGE
jgi:polysaccharide biosynthesis PFTS motif protein